MSYVIFVLLVSRRCLAPHPCLVLCFVFVSSLTYAWIIKLEGPINLTRKFSPIRSEFQIPTRRAIKIAISKNSNDRLQKRYISVDVTTTQYKDATFLLNYRCVYTNYLSRHEMAEKSNKWPEKLSSDLACVIYGRRAHAQNQTAAREHVLPRCIKCPSDLFTPHYRRVSSFIGCDSWQ